MMDTWHWLLLACALAFLTKLTGFLVPTRWLDGAHMRRISNAMTIGLLAALVTLNTVADGTGLRLDARLGALMIAATALTLRVPFLLVVVLGAAATAILRWLTG